MNKQMYNQLIDILLKDPTEEKNIGTFTSIHNNELTEKFALHYLNKNLVDKKAYKSLTTFETKIDRFFKKTFDNKVGTTILTSGSTESVLLAFYYAREKAKHEKGITKPNMLIPTHAHYSLARCARMLEIEVRDINEDKQLAADIEEVKQKVDKNTILIVGILGSTELGVIDNIQAMDEIATKNNTWIHVDAAIGGFIIPFLDTNLKYKFSQLPSMQSINISGHKFGLALCGAGVLLLRDKQTTEKYADTIEYLSSGKKKMDNLLITSSPLGLFSLYTNIALYGESGYKKFARKYMSAKKELMKKLDRLGVPYFSGAEYTPQIFIYKDDIEELSEYLATKGWVQHTYKAKGLNKEGIRIVIKKDQEDAIVEDLVGDMETFYSYKQTENPLAHLPLTEHRSAQQ
jgi:glutamate/tyrosine decarboxylase-like PLP-dependent enzyme